MDLENPVHVIGHVLYNLLKGSCVCECELIPFFATEVDFVTFKITTKQVLKKMVFEMREEILE